MRHLKKGFTLIELLIVIALLGILAVALLAALDPLEQIKKGNDTGVRNQVSEIHSSILRYFAIKNGSMPWGNSTLNWGAMTSTEQNAALQSVVDTGELKVDFISQASGNLDKIYMTGTGENVAVCYTPTSKSFRSDLNTKYALGNGSVGMNNNCPNSSAVGASGTCYWCVQ